MDINVEEIVKEMELNNIHIHDIIENKNEFSISTMNKDREHICLAMPINRGITSEATTSIFQLYAHLQKHYSVSLCMSIATYLHEGRNLIMKNAHSIHVKAPIDYMFWIDSDSVFEVGDFERLLKMSKKKDLAFLSGLYFTKRSKACKPVFVVKKGKDYKLAEDYPPNSLLRVDGVGFGFFLARGKEAMELFEKYKSKLFMLEEKDNTGRLVGEDIVFSKCVTAEGHKMWVWTDVQIGHEGGITQAMHFHAIKNKEVLDKLILERKSKFKEVE